MKLWYSPASPFVRKVMVTAHECGKADAIELERVTTTAVASDSRLREKNPLGKIPAMETDNGEVLFGSSVICAYLAENSEKNVLGPAEGTEKFRAMTLEALADGIMEAAVLVRYELALRPEKYQWSEWVDGQMAKVEAGLGALENTYSSDLKKGVTIGSIAAACALSYLDFRFPQLDWRKSHAELVDWHASFAKRPSMLATEPE